VPSPPQGPVPDHGNGARCAEAIEENGSRSALGRGRGIEEVGHVGVSGSLPHRQHQSFDPPSLSQSGQCPEVSSRRCDRVMNAGPFTRSEGERRSLDPALGLLCQNLGPVLRIAGTIGVIVRSARLYRRVARSIAICPPRHCHQQGSSLSATTAGRSGPDGARPCWTSTGSDEEG
jgi:hypothetical protein